MRTSPLSFVRLFLFAFLLASALSPRAAAGQNPSTGEALEGTWSGTFEAGSQRLTLIFHLQRGEEDSTLTATMDVPQQSAEGVPVSEVRAAGDSLRLGIPQIGGAFEGRRTGADTIDGAWRQGGRTFPLALKRGEGEALRRPQTPEPPFPYRTEDVRFPGGMGDVTLAGTLALPEAANSSGGPPPAVVLVSGSGPQNRDSEVAGHKIFLVLADYLARQGVAVLRYDERGVGASTGDFSQATTHTLAADARAALSYLRERQGELGLGPLGLVGMSEGGLVGPMLAAHHPEALDFLVLMAGPGVSGAEVLPDQYARLAAAQGLPAERVDEIRAQWQRLTNAVAQAPDSSTAAAQALEAVGDTPIWPAGDRPQAARQQALSLTEPWPRHFLSYDPRPALRETSVPVLALFGEKDMQVPPDPNASVLREALAGNTDATVRVLPGLNHLFQNAKTGMPNEYGQIDETMAPAALEAVARWIAERTRAGAE